MRHFTEEACGDHLLQPRPCIKSFPAERGIADLPVRPALVFIDAEFGLFRSPIVVDGVWIVWGMAVRKLLVEETIGQLPVGELAKRLARELRPGVSGG